LSEFFPPPEQGLKAAEISTKVFYHSDVASLAKLNIEEVKQVFPLSAVSEIPFEAGISILDLAMKAGCFLNEGDAKRIIAGGGLYLNFERITSEAVLVPNHHILPNNISLIRIGKILIKFDRDFTNAEEASVFALKGTTRGTNLYSSLTQTLEKCELDFSNMSAITRDGAKSMTGEKIGIATLLKSDVKGSGNNTRMTFHCINPLRKFVQKVLLKP
ncbi:uncharacterized protein LOC118202457, partial [Stegodyphus dumicola]|uniref:uncharacterized protein LOC118202457 n=1 Tax=Stegodyphus dumicola TaxID=202533 RepID=UPI0015AE1355